MTKGFTTISICLPVLAFWKFLYNWVCWALWLCFEQDLLSGGGFGVLFFYNVVMVPPDLCPSVKVCLGYPAAQEKLLSCGHKFWALSPGTGADFFELEWYADSFSPSTSVLCRIYMWAGGELIHRFCVPVMPCQLMRRVAGRTILKHWCSLTVWKSFQADSLERIAWILLWELFFSSPLSQTSAGPCDPRRKSAPAHRFQCRTSLMEENFL